MPKVPALYRDGSVLRPILGPEDQATAERASKAEIEGDLHFSAEETEVREVVEEVRRQQASQGERSGMPGGEMLLRRSSQEEQGQLELASSPETSGDLEKAAEGRPYALRPRTAGEQNVGTPRDLLDAIEARWGKLTLDLCASADNACAPAFLSEATDSLKADWSALRGLGWCNPPFKKIAPWVKKASETKLRRGAKILVLTPASVGSDWFRLHVWGKARVIFLNGRAQFQGHDAPYPKDLQISVFGELPSTEIWTWKTIKRSRASLTAGASNATPKKETGE